MSTSTLALSLDSCLEVPSGLGVDALLRVLLSPGTNDSSDIQAVVCSLIAAVLLQLLLK
jgi:hypothetical protein